MDIQKTYGWKRDLPDDRDFIFKFVRAVTLPSSIDLRPGCSAIEDQGNLGSCTSQAAVGALEYMCIKDGVTFLDLSRLFVYYNTRVIENTVRYDDGASLRNTVKALAKQGACKETLWPYIIKQFNIKPRADCYTDGIKRTIVSYSRLFTLNDMKSCLASSFPFICGISLYESFEFTQVGKTGIVNMPTSREKMLGGHAIMIVGYDDKTSRFIGRNSWGNSWGMHGYFTIPYKYITNFGADFWVIRTGNEI